MFFLIIVMWKHVAGDQILGRLFSTDLIVWRLHHRAMNDPLGFYFNAKSPAMPFGAALARNLGAGAHSWLRSWRDDCATNYFGSASHENYFLRAQNLIRMCSKRKTRFMTQRFKDDATVISVAAEKFLKMGFQRFYARFGDRRHVEVLFFVV